MKEQRKLPTKQKNTTYQKKEDIINDTTRP